MGSSSAFVGDPGDAESQREAISKRYTTLDEHAWGLLNHANVLAAIITQANDLSEMPSVLYLLSESPLIGVRGIFPTLLQLLPDILSSTGQTSTFQPSSAR